MKDIKYEIPEMIGEEKSKFSGSFVVKVPKRADRCTLQMEALKAAENAKENSGPYVAFSEKILDANLVSLSVVHTESGMQFTKREDLEYMEAELLISMIVQIVVGGQKLGKQIA